MGVGLKERRTSLGLRQAEIGDRSGVSQSWVSRMERGHGRTASLETWAAVGMACDLDLHAYLDVAPGATRPLDYAHLKRQQLVASVARPGGWEPDFEVRIDPDWPRSRSDDVLLEPRTTRDAPALARMDNLDNVGVAWRGLDT
jgi:transcriptional regulator with XRE-family HTH domain